MNIIRLKGQLRILLVLEKGSKTVKGWMIVLLSDGLYRTL